MGRYATHGLQVRSHPYSSQSIADSTARGYLESCRNIVTAARRIAEGIRTSIPELYVVGDPPASVVAFASKHPSVDVMEVGDVMSKRGWHLNALLDPKAVHIACTVSALLMLALLGCFWAVESIGR